MTEDNCIFCKIANKEVESFTLYEDDLVSAFLDVNPVSTGHTLIVPKQHYESVFDIPKPTLERIIGVGKDLAERYTSILEASGINFLNASGKDAQQSVFHFHMHLVPRFPNDGLDLWFHNYAKQDKDLKSLYEKLRIKH